MVDLHEGFRCLVDPPLAEPEPMGGLQRRARAVRRRRRASQAGTLAVVVLGLLGLTSLLVGDGGLGPIRSPRVVFDQPGSDARLAPAPEGWQTHDEDGIAFHYPADWSVVADPDGPEVIVGIHPLDERDAHLALFGRPDVMFSANFPRDAVVFSIGGDRFRAPGPHEGLEEEMAVQADGGTGEDATVRARFGKVAASIHQMAAYAGPGAAAEHWASVEQIAETVVQRQPRTGDIPPPPPGPPGFPEGREQPVASATDEVLRQPLPLPGYDRHVVLLTGDGCAVVALDNPTDRSDPHPQSGRCGLDAPPPADDHVGEDALVVGDAPMPHPDPPSDQPAGPPPGVQGQEAPPPPASEPAPRPPEGEQPPDAPAPGLSDDTFFTMFVATQVGERVERVEARLVDGRVIDGEVGDGWALMTTDGRIAWLTAYDADGTELTTAFIR